MSSSIDERRPRARRRALLLLFVLLVSALGLELGLRAVLALRGQPYSAAATAERLRQLADVDQRELIAPELAGEAGAEPAEDARDPTELLLDPFLGFAPRGKTPQLAGELRRQRRTGPDASFDLLLLGGSVAGQFGSVGTKRLFELMREDPRFEGVELRCAAFSTGGYKQPQQSIRLLQLLYMGYQPDLVLELDGYNELSLSAGNAESGTAPYYPSIFHWAHLVQRGLGDPAVLDAVVAIELQRRELARAAERARSLRVHHSAVLGRLAVTRLEAMRAREVALSAEYEALLLQDGQREELRGPEFPLDERAVVLEIVRTWEEASRTMHDICAARGVPYVHVLQPALHDAGSKPLAPREQEIAAQEAPRTRAVRDGYPLLRAAGARLAARGVRFLDASGVFADDPTERYYDPCHFDPGGCRKLAELVAPAVLAACRD